MTSWRIRNEVLWKLKTGETTLGKSLDIVPKRTIKGCSMMSKQFMAEVAQELEKIIANFKYEAGMVFGGLKASLS